jgi:hypothetical protein
MPQIARRGGSPRAQGDGAGSCAAVNGIPDTLNRKRLRGEKGRQVQRVSMQRADLSLPPQRRCRLFDREATREIAADDPTNAAKAPVVLVIAGLGGLSVATTMGRSARSVSRPSSRDVETGELERLRIAGLRSISGAEPSVPPPDLSELDDRDWNEALQRLDLIQPVLDAARLPRGGDERTSARCPGRGDDTLPLGVPVSRDWAALVAVALQTRRRLRLTFCLEKQQTMQQERNARYDDPCRFARRADPSLVLRCHSSALFHVSMCPL